MRVTLSVFSYKAKYLGMLLIIGALPFAYLYFWGGKPEFFTVKVFAVVTTYMETRYFVLSQTNILDELAAIMFLSGITLVSFSKEKNEKEVYEKLRFKAFVNSLYITIFFWIVSFLVVYGLAIFVVSFSVFIVFLIAYNGFFRYYFFKERKAELLHFSG